IVQATCTFIPVVLCFPEYSSGCPAHDQHGSSVPSTKYCAFASRSPAVGTYSRRACTKQRGNCRDGTADGGLRDTVILSYFLLNPVPAQVLQGHGESIAQSEYRRPTAHSRL